MEQTPTRRRRSSSASSGGRRQQPQTRRPAPKKRKRRSIGWTLYAILVVISAIIVGVYAAGHFFIKAPPIEGTEGDVSKAPVVDESTQEPEDPNALIRKEGVYNFLLLGKDVDSSNTDTLIVVSYDTVNQKIGMVSIPRDTAVAREWSSMPKINAAFHSKKAGPEVLKQEIKNTFGIPIDYYVHVDLKGFVALVDELGGVDIEVPLDMNYDDPYQDLHIHLNAGMQHLNGQQTMQAVRYRHDNDDSPNYKANQWYSDVQRGEFQRQVLIELAKKVISWNSIPKVTSFLDLFNTYIETDLSMQDMLYFATKAMEVDVSTAIQQGNLEGRGEGVVNGYKYCFVYEAEDILPTINSLINPYTRDLTADDLNLPVPEYYWNGGIID